MLRPVLLHEGLERELEKHRLGGPGRVEEDEVVGHGAVLQHSLREGRQGGLHGGLVHFRTGSLPQHDVDAGERNGVRGRDSNAGGVCDKDDGDAEDHDHVAHEGRQSDELVVPRHANKEQNQIYLLLLHILYRNKKK